MATSRFSHVKITGISTVVPKQEIRLEDELEFFGDSLKKVERVKKMIGIGARRIADTGVTAADLCQQAAENMLDGLSCDRTTIDALIFISQAPDYAFPATACILQDKLGLPKTCAAFDVNQGCSAYTYGLWLVSSLLESGACKKALLLVGDTPSRKSDRANRVVAPIFGDCGSATLIEYSAEPVASYYILGTDGSGAEALIAPAGHARIPLESFADCNKAMEPIVDVNNNPWFFSRMYMDGGTIFNFTMNVVPEHIQELLVYSGYKPEDIDWLVLHQANRQIASNLAAKVGFPEVKAPTETVAKYGNQAGASLPGVICDQLSDKVQSQPARLLLSGYGVGLSWASAVVHLDKIWCSGIQEFISPKDLLSTETLVDYWENKFKNTGKM